MKKLILSILGLLISFNAHATICTVPYPNELTGAFIYAAHWNANVVAIQTCLNNQTLDGTTNISIGGIQTANLANLAVTDAKIFGITTAGKVNGSAITQINNVPSGAGALPAMNGGTGADLSAATQGNVPYFASAGVQSYTASGTAGQFLESQGASSNPVFGYPTAGAYSYGSSASSFTLTTAPLKVAFGNISTTSGSGTAITNLPFTSSTSYAVAAMNTDNTSVPCLITTITSGASFSITNGSGTHPCWWIAEGT